MDEADLRSAFDMFDKNGNGEIERDELKTVMQSLGQNPTQKDVQDMIKTHDLNKDGSINFEEFKTMMSGRMKTPEQISEDLKISFKLFDKNGDGKISSSELKEVMTGLGEPLSDQEVKEMIEEADCDNDGFINYNEFITLFNSGPVASQKK